VPQQPAAAPTPAAQPPAAATPAPSRPRLPVRYLVLGALLVLALLTLPFAFIWWFHRLTHSITDDAFVEAHIVNIAPEMVSGRIVRFLVDENDHVAQGQLLAEIEPVHYRDQVEQARSKLDLAKAELQRQEEGLRKLKNEVREQIAIAEQTRDAAKVENKRASDNMQLTKDEVYKTIDEAKAAVAVAKANAVLAKQEYDRWLVLAKQQASTTRKAQEVTASYHAATASVQLAEAKLAKAEKEKTRILVAQRDLELAGVLVIKAEKALALAETGHDQIREVKQLVSVKKESVKDAQIALDSAEHVLQFTQIRAPFPGVVVKRYRHLGDFASPGVAILSMYNPDLLYVTANLEETRLHGVAPGNPVELQVDAFGEPFHGRVVWIDKSTGAQFALMPRNVVSGEFTKVVQRLPVRIWIEKDERWPLLRAGLSVRAVIAHGEGDAPWAEQTARQMRDLEKRYNQPPAPAKGPGEQP
jgi:membrane fusion protein (multidrug efflux system)